jgi:peptidoglycan/LPS O-acetylase OafA/YrhL
MLAVVLVAALVASPLFRHANLHWMTPTNTLIHLDGIAWGSLLALGLLTVKLSRRTWLVLGLSGLVVGFTLAATIAGGTSFLDSALAVCFAGAVLAAIASTGAHNPVNAAMRKGPLPFYGKISYGLYMIHIAVFIFFGWFDMMMNGKGLPGNLAIVGFRVAASTAAATAMWYGFEKQMLKLKRYF